MPTQKFFLKDERLRAGFRSNAELAEQILARWAKLDPRSDRPKPRSLAAKLSELDSNPVWWRNHPKASQALAAALGLRLEDLPLAAATLSPRRHRFADFPDLPELDLTNDAAPCRLMETPWWSVDLLKGRTWVAAPRGAGKTLAAAIHRARGEHVIAVSRLVDAVPQLPADGPVVIQVEGPDPETDETAADQLVSDRRLLVLANFPVPVGPRRLAHAMEVFKDNPSEWRSSEQVRELVSRIDWQSLGWDPVPGWRDQFLRWIFDRLDTDERHLAAVRKWLDDHDPEKRLFATPGDVLAVAGRAWESSIARLGPDGLIRWWIERRVNGAPADGGARSAWLTTLGERALRALADAAFDDASVMFPVRAPTTWWSEKIPEDIAPADPVKVLAVRVQEIAREPRRRQRDVLARAWKREAVRVSAIEAIVHLRAAHVFQPSGARSVELAPPWVVEWWAEARAKSLMLYGEPRVWGRLAAEPSRRRLIEKVLDALDRRSLLALVERALGACAEEEPPGLGTVAAVEAIFGAVGRHLLKPNARAADWPTETMHALFARQREWLMLRYDGDTPRPLTRATAERQGDAPWIAECWAWSLVLPAPPYVTDDTHAWLFPGWSNVSLATSPRWLDSIRAESPSFDSVSRLANRVLRRTTDASLPDRLPDALVTAAVVNARERGWALGGGHVESIAESTRLAGVFVEWLRSLAPEHRRPVLADFWQVLAATPNWSVPRLRKERPEILDLLADGLDLGEVEAVAARGGIPFWSMKERPLWPTTWWNAVMRSLIPRHHRELHQLHDVHLDADAAEVVEALVDADERDHHWKEVLWRVAPTRAHECAVAAYPDGVRAALWFFTAPGAARASLVEAVERRSASPIPPWTRRWLVQILPDAGADAERVFRLLVR